MCAIILWFIAVAIMKQRSTSLSTLLALDLVLPKKKPDEPFKVLLNTVQALIETWSTHVESLRDEVRDQFENNRDEMSAEELAGYQDDSGKVTDAAIFSHIGDGSLNLSMEEWPDEKEPYAVFYFGVDWDSEHGFQMDLELP